MEVMPTLPSKSIDMILCDLPYGTTACKWDTIIPFDKLWFQYERIIKDNGAVVLTGSQPFTSMLVMSNLKWFKYECVWEKDQGRNFQNCKNQPLKTHENVCVFSLGRVNYYPQGLIKSGKVKSNKNKNGRIGHMASEFLRSEYVQEFSNYPKSIIKSNSERGLHPTQKPVALFEYLIKTYTNEGDTVLDNRAGSGTTGVAAEQCNRNSIMIEKEPKYCEIIRQRMAGLRPSFF